MAGINSASPATSGSTFTWAGSGASSGHGAQSSPGAPASSTSTSTLSTSHSGSPFAVVAAPAAAPSSNPPLENSPPPEGVPLVAPGVAEGSPSDPGSFVMVPSVHHSAPAESVGASPDPTGIDPLMSADANLDRLIALAQGGSGVSQGGGVAAGVPLVAAASSSSAAMITDEPPRGRRLAIEGPPASAGDSSSPRAKSPRRAVADDVAVAQWRYRFRGEEEECNTLRRKMEKRLAKLEKCEKEEAKYKDMAILNGNAEADQAHQRRALLARFTSECQMYGDAVKEVSALQSERDSGAQEINDLNSEKASLDATVVRYRAEMANAVEVHEKTCKASAAAEHQLQQNEHMLEQSLHSEASIAQRQTAAAQEWHAIAVRVAGQNQEQQKMIADGEAQVKHQWSEMSERYKARQTQVEELTTKLQCMTLDCDTMRTELKERSEELQSAILERDQSKSSSSYLCLDLQSRLRAEEAKFSAVVPAKDDQMQAIIKAAREIQSQGRKMVTNMARERDDVIMKLEQETKLREAESAKNNSLNEVIEALTAKQAELVAQLEDAQEGGDWEGWVEDSEGRWIPPGLAAPPPTSTQEAAPSLVAGVSLTAATAGVPLAAATPSASASALRAPSVSGRETRGRSRDPRTTFQVDTDATAGGPAGRPGPSPPHGDEGQQQRQGRSSSPRHRSDDDDDGHGSSTSPSHRQRRNRSPEVKRREAEKLTVPAFPSIAGLQEWKIRAYQMIISASGREDHKVIAWLNKVEDPQTTFEELGTVQGSMVTLDHKLALALCGIITKANAPRLANEIHMKSTTMIKSGHSLKGRQILWMLFRFFQTHQQLGMVYTIQDLAQLPAATNASLVNFKFNWDKMVENMPTKLDDPTLAMLLKGKIEKVTDLQYDLSYYEREGPTPSRPEGGRDHTYQYLMEAIDRLLAKRQRDLNRSNMLASHANAAPGPSQPKKNGKGKGGGGGNGSVPSAAPKAGGDAAPAGGSKGGGKAKSKAKGKAKAKGKKKGGGGSSGASSAGSNKSNSSGKAGSSKKPCYFYHHDTCKKGKQCKFSHAAISPEQKAKLQKPPNKRSASAASSGSGGSKSPSGKKGGGGKGGKSFLQVCHKFKANGTCDRQNCGFLHLYGEAAVEYEKQANALRAKANANKK